MTRSILRFSRDKAGATAVEFAIIGPVFVLCAFGILCFGMYFGAVHAVQQLASEAARASIAGLNSADRRALAISRVMIDVGSYPFLSEDRMTVASVDTDPSTDTFTVTLRYDASSLPIFGLPYVPLPPSVIVRSATIQRGGY